MINNKQITLLLGVNLHREPGPEAWWSSLQLCRVHPKRRSGHSSPFEDVIAPAAHTGTGMHAEVG